MRIARFIGSFFLLGLLSALAAVSQEQAVLNGSQVSDAASGRTPRVTIAQPVTGCEVRISPGTRPSLLVRGEADEIPDGYRLYLGVHPTHSDSVWTQEVPASRQWLTQAYFGGDSHTPRDGESFELIALLADDPPPDQFSELDNRSYYVSEIVTVKVSVRSWLDRAVAFMKDLGISVPIATLLATVGGLLGAWLERRAAARKEASRKTAAPGQGPSGVAET